MIYSGISPTPGKATTRDNRTMPKRGKNSLRQEVATELHDGLGQHLLGSMLSARVLVKMLEERNAPELDEAKSLLNHLRSASDNIQDIIRKLDVGHSS
jgi:signal transduction histidine kinase